MTGLEAIRTALPESARDTKLNLQSVLDGGPLTEAQRWGVAVAAALAARNDRLHRAVLQEAREKVGAGVLNDAEAAASLMAMTNVYYRFRHLVGKPEYAARPARLRMNRIARPEGEKLDFELMCLAVSAINGCEACIRSHEQVVRDGGLTEDHVHDAVRIAAVMHAAAVALAAAEEVPETGPAVI